MRDTLPQARPDRVSSRLPPRVHAFSIRQTEPPPVPPYPPPNFLPRQVQSDEIHYHSTDILALNHNIPGASSTSEQQQFPNSESIKNFQSNETSPYAKRKTNLSSFKSTSKRTNNGSIDQRLPSSSRQSDQYLFWH
jgi:hypothetical protein